VTQIKNKLAEKAQEIIKEYEGGNSCGVISRRYNCSNESVRQFLVRNNIDRRKPSTYRKHKLNERFFEKVDTQEKAWLLGFILADGSIKKHNGGYYILFELSVKDKGLLNKIINTLKSSYKIRTNEKKSSASLALSSKKMYYDLHKLGIVENKTYKYNSVKGISNKLMRHFIRGYFDGDGWVSLQKNQCTFGIVGHRELLKEIEENLRINCRLNKRKKPLTKLKNTQVVVQFAITGNLQVMRVRDYIYGGATIFLKRKKQIFDKVRSHRSEYITNQRTASLLRVRDANGRFL